VCQYTPRKRKPIEQRTKQFYKEAQKLPSRVVFGASKEAKETPETQEDWVLVEGTQKRRQIAPKGRGRPKAFERVDNSHGNIEKFVVLTSQIPPTAIPETQTPAPASVNTTQEALESIDVD